ncbi:MAG TPA: helix-turn-helix transcriptional regulator, partial [Candidatus Caccousia stercoris]|nr:helix-turn-helix transcriptional regulator [Candidatus Caccousia stercoris]
CRYFKELTHRTPIDYLNYYRIEVACEQMVYSHRALTEIAYDCGFTDSSYFIKVFRHYKHMSPTQYMLGTKKLPEQ